MTWQPVKKVSNQSRIAANLLAYIKAHQVAALGWASPSETLKPFAKFWDSVGNRNKPIFPSFAFSDDDDTTDYTSDLVVSEYGVQFEAMIQNADPDKAVRLARLYFVATASLIRNIPKADLLAETGVDNFTLTSIRRGFEQIKAHKQETSFLQVFQIRAVYTLRAGNES